VADLSDVSMALRNLIGATLYPHGSATASVTKTAISIMIGWPGPQDVDAAIAAGTTLINVYPLSGMERNTMRVQADWQELTVPAATYTLSAAGQAITVGGAAPAAYFAQNVYTQISGVGYRYATQDGDTAATVAAGLLTLIEADWPSATVSGAVLTIPATARIEALRVGVTGTVIKEVGRQERSWQIVIWSPSEALRTTIAKAIDLVLRQTPRLLLTDGTYGHLSYKGSPVMDALQKAAVFRRDLIYTCEYSTTVSETTEQIVDFLLNFSPTIDGTTAEDTVSISI
jgi:hypothetical protein